MFESVVDPLRLLAVPLLGWAAVRDVRTRRVPNWVWAVLAGLGALLLLVDLVSWYPFDSPRDLLRLTQVGMSLFFVAPLGYFFWRIGGFGGADAKALMALAVLFPTFPRFVLPVWLVDLGIPPVLPAQSTAIGVFSLTILTNTVLVGVLFPLVLAARNAAAGEFGVEMFLARVVPVESLAVRHGRLFETPEGFTTSGLDIDALRMYLRWRGLSLADLRADPSRYRLPGSVEDTHDPTDGAVDPDLRTDGGHSETTEADVEETDGDAATTADAATTDAEETASAEEPVDEWAADRFLDELDGSAYGTTPKTLREGLETVVANEEVWVSPGLPFIVPMFAGLVLALTYGDLLFGFLVWLGLG
jgi:preflagellin peptidase FlaK